MKQIKQMLEHLRSLTFDIKTNKTPPAQKKKKKKETWQTSKKSLLREHEKLIFILCTNLAID